MEKTCTFSGRRLWIAIAVTLLFTSCVVQKNPVSGKKRAYAYTWEQEQQIGKQADQQIIQQYGIYHYDNLNNFVNGIADQVLAKSDLRKPTAEAKYRNAPFTFRVLNSPVVNAFALPGGYVYVTRGLLASLDNEAQLAMVLGHEIGHVAARHASQSALQQKIGQLTLLGGAVIGQEVFNIPGGDILNLGGTATQLLFLRYSRDHEREADRLGVEYSAKAGYHSSEAAAFFSSLQRMQKQSGQTLPSFLSTHPDPGDRKQTIEKLSRQWHQDGYSMTVIKRDTYLNEINGIVYGNNPREGFIGNGYFYHPELRFKFPAPDSTTWDMVNQASMVAFVEKGQHAVMILEPDTTGTPRTSVQNVIKNTKATVIGSNQSEHNGIPGWEATATVVDNNGNTLELYIYSLNYNSQVYRFVDYTAESDFKTYEPVFIKSAHGFSRLEDSAILNIKPVRIKVIRTGKTESLQSLLPSNLPADIKPEDVAIMNQIQLNENIPAGTLIKIPLKE